MRLLVFVFLVALASAEKARFYNYRVYTVVPENEHQLSVLANLELDGKYDFWTSPSFVNASIDIMVPPHHRDEFQSLLDDIQLESNLKIEDVQSLIDAEENSVRFRSSSMDWTAYHKLNEIHEWLDELAEKYPNTVKVVVGGKSFEGREIKGIEIKFGENLTGVVLETGIHSREWIGPAATSWMVNELVTGNVDPIFKRFNYLYFPSINPDGYVYTWEKNRMWRKTRKPYKKAGRTCYGADPNRNFNFHFGEIGVSKDPCMETYSGPEAFSEVEMKTYAEYLKSISQKFNLKLYLAYHSYSQLILYPWGYTWKPSKDEEKFFTVASAAADAIKAVHQMDFTVGSISTTIYPTSGTSVEWVYAVLNATITFAYELRDKGRYGFVLPAEQIIPSGEETLASLKAVLQEYEKLK